MKSPAGTAAGRDEPTRQAKELFMPKPKLPGIPGLCVLLGIALVLASFPPGGARADSETVSQSSCPTGNSLRYVAKESSAVSQSGP